MNLYLAFNLGDLQLIKMQEGTGQRDIFIPDDISVIQSRQDQHPDNKNQLKSANAHTYGGLHINYLLYFFIPILIFACIFSYHEAVSKKEEKPFPHATITNTACHYPQDIVFRYFMLPAGGFINLVYFCIFRWLSKESKRIGYEGSIYSQMLPLGQISTFGFLAAIGTIDGNGYPVIHDIGAVFFFIVLFLLAIIITLVVRDMHSWDSTFVNRNSFLSKTLFAGYLIGMVIYCLVDAVLHINEQQNDDDPDVVILQWNLVFFGLAWLMTFKFDWTHVFITLKGDFSSTVKKIVAE